MYVSRSLSSFEGRVAFILPLFSPFFALIFFILFKQVLSQQVEDKKGRGGNRKFGAFPPYITFFLEEEGTFLLLSPACLRQRRERISYACLLLPLLLPLFLPPSFQHFFLGNGWTRFPPLFLPFCSHTPSIHGKEKDTGA